MQVVISLDFVWKGVWEFWSWLVGEFLEVGWDYVQWKQEWEQIDLVCFVWYRDVQGDWCCLWDLDKVKFMLQDCSQLRGEGLVRVGSRRGFRSYWKLQFLLLFFDGKGWGG